MTTDEIMALADAYAVECVQDYYAKHSQEKFLALRAAVEQIVREAAEYKRDAERWRMLPAFLEEYQIDYLKLLRDTDAAIDAAMEKK